MWVVIFISLFRWPQNFFLGFLQRRRKERSRGVTKVWEGRKFSWGKSVKWKMTCKKKSVRYKIGIQPQPLPPNRIFIMRSYQSGFPDTDLNFCLSQIWFFNSLYWCDCSLKPIHNAHECTTRYISPQIITHPLSLGQSTGLARLYVNFAEKRRYSQMLLCPFLGPQM